jgi:hypothetical protein
MSDGFALAVTDRGTELRGQNHRATRFILDEAEGEGLTGAREKVVPVLLLQPAAFVWVEEKALDLTCVLAHGHEPSRDTSGAFRSKALP